MTPHEYVSPLRPENRVTGWKPCHEKRDGRQRPSGAGDGRGQPSRTHEGQEDARSSRALNLGGTTKALHGHQSLLFVPKLTRLGEKQVFLRLENLDAVLTIEGFPSGGEPETGMRQWRIPGRVQ